MLAQDISAGECLSALTEWHRQLLLFAEQPAIRIDAADQPATAPRMSVAPAAIAATPFLGRAAGCGPDVSNGGMSQGGDPGNSGAA